MNSIVQSRKLLLHLSVRIDQSILLLRMLVLVRMLVPLLVPPLVPLLVQARLGESTSRGKSSRAEAGLLPLAVE